MQQLMDQMLQGSFDYETGSLDFSCSKIELTLSPGAFHEGSFTIYAQPGRLVSGTVLSSDLRMECLTPSFSGGDEVISFRFRGQNLEDGDEVRGQFTVISNQGEYALPFLVKMETPYPESSVGPVRNLFYFANLAKSSWQEAVKLFDSPGLKRIFQGNDSQYYEVYRGLAARPGREQNVEEFLIAAGRKKPAQFLVQEPVLSLYGCSGMTETAVTVMRSGWGFTRLQVETEGEFLFSEKETLTDDDFLGNSCRLPVYVDGQLLHRGRNYGRITLRGAYQTLQIPVVVRMGDAGGTAVMAGREKKRLLVQLMGYYQSFRLKKISSAIWLKETGRLVERMISMDDKDIAARLFQAQLLITQQRDKEAEWILDHAAELMRQMGFREPELWAYYLYLTTLLHPDEDYIDEVTEQVEEIYRRGRSSWRAAWLLLYLSRDYSRSATGKWCFLEKQFQYGCTSPILYIEALLMLNHNPAILRRLTRFELQVLAYGSRQDMLSAELVEQLLYLAGRVRDYSETLLKILTACYWKEADIRILQEICTLLIKGGQTGPKAFPWYELGVAGELRITKLYEYYMMSIDMEEEHPVSKTALMYFSYQNNLDYEHAAFLYSYIHRHREEFPELYGLYRDRMERFVVEQIQKEHINRHLSYLYEELLSPGMVGEQTAAALARLLFARLLRVETNGMHKAVVYQKDSLEESVYPLAERETWVAMYGDDSTLFLEDGEGGRYVKSIPYTLEKLMEPGRFLKWVTPYVRTSTELNLYLCEQGMQRGEFTSDIAQRGLMLTVSPSVSAGIKGRICRQLLEFFYKEDDMRHLDEYLDQVPAGYLSASERGEVIRFQVLRGKYDTAAEWLRRYGPYNVQVKPLVRLLNAQLQKISYCGDPVLVGAAQFVFRNGKYDGSILKYLSGTFQGGIREMKDIWKAAVDFDVDCCELSERMLVQMLYTGSFPEEKMDIFRYYLKRGARTEVEEAFLAQCSYEALMKDSEPEALVVEEICRLRRCSEPVRKECKLAALKYWARNPAAGTDGRAQYLQEFLREMMGEGIHLNFYREMHGAGELLAHLQDKTIVEYRSHCGDRVTIHYVVSQENGETGEYMTEDMARVCGGYYFKEFVLFFGESLQYYIVEERGGEEQMTDNGTIYKGDTPSDVPSCRYEQINDIMICSALKDYDTLDRMMEEYSRKDYQNRELFRLRRTI